MTNYQSIRPKENKLLDRIKSKINELNSCFWKYGVVSADYYKKIKIKTLFVLKEANWERDGDLRCFLSEGAYGYGWKTWNPVALFSFGVVNQFPSWKSVCKLDRKALRKEQLKMIAAVNLKKTFGPPPSRINTIEKYLWKYPEEFKAHIKLCEPDVVICCGKSYGNIFLYLFGENVNKWEKLEKRGRYCTSENVNGFIGKPVHIIEINHPQYTGESYEQKYDNFKRLFNLRN